MEEVENLRNTGPKVLPSLWSVHVQRLVDGQGRGRQEGPLHWSRWIALRGASSPAAFCGMIKILKDIKMYKFLFSMEKKLEGRTCPGLQRSVGGSQVPTVPGEDPAPPWPGSQC